MKPRITINQNKDGELEIWLNEAGETYWCASFSISGNGVIISILVPRSSMARYRSKVAPIVREIESSNGAKLCSARTHGTPNIFRMCLRAESSNGLVPLSTNCGHFGLTRYRTAHRWKMIEPDSSTSSALCA